MSSNEYLLANFGFDTASRTSPVKSARSPRAASNPPRSRRRAARPRTSTRRRSRPTASTSPRRSAARRSPASRAASRAERLSRGSSGPPARLNAFCLWRKCSVPFPFACFLFATSFRVSQGYLSRELTFSTFLFKIGPI